MAKDDGTTPADAVRQQPYPPEPPALLAEPDRTPLDLNFSLFGFPVRVHPLFWLVATILFARSGGELPDYMSCIAALFFSILIHELGHAFAMRYYGMSAHVVLYMLGGLAVPEPGVSTRGMRTMPQIIISAAGPLTEMAVAYVVILSFMAAGHRDNVFFYGPLNLVPAVWDIGHHRLVQFVNFFCWVSVYWGLLNLLPIYPLDGGQIAREALMAYRPHRGLEQSLVISILAAVLMAIYAAVAWKSIFTTILFAYLAFGSYQYLDAYRRGGRW